MKSKLIIGAGGDNAISNVFGTEKKKSGKSRERLYSTYVRLFAICSAFL